MVSVAEASITRKTQAPEAAVIQHHHCRKRPSRCLEAGRHLRNQVKWLYTIWAATQGADEGQNQASRRQDKRTIKVEEAKEGLKLLHSDRVWKRSNVQDAGGKGEAKKTLFCIDHLAHSAAARRKQPPGDGGEWLDPGWPPECHPGI